MVAKTTIFRCLTGVYAVALLAWPIACFLTIFAFDDPRGPRLSGYYLVVSIWLYPVYVACGYFLGSRSAKQNEHTLLVAVKSSVPLLSAMWYVLLLLGGSVGWDALTKEHYHRLLIEAKVYGLGDNRFAVKNPQGWFTDHTGFNMRNPEPFSAWVVDLTRETPNKNNRIYLSKENLDRNFFRNRDIRTLARVPKWSANERHSVSCQFDLAEPVGITLFTPNGEYFLMLKQD